MFSLSFCFITSFFFWFLFPLPLLFFLLYFCHVFFPITSILLFFLLVSIFLIPLFSYRSNFSSFYYLFCSCTFLPYLFFYQIPISYFFHILSVYSFKFLFYSCPVLSFSHIFVFCLFLLILYFLLFFLMLTHFLSLVPSPVCHALLPVHSLGGVPGRVLQHVPGPLAAAAQKTPTAFPASQQDRHVPPRIPAEVQYFRKYSPLLQNVGCFYLRTSRTLKLNISCCTGCRLR